MSKHIFAAIYGDGHPAEDGNVIVFTTDSEAEAWYKAKYMIKTFTEDEMNTVFELKTISDIHTWLSMSQFKIYDLN